jgi:hypothetical protein
MEFIARPLWTPQKVANEASIRAISMENQADEQRASARAAVALHAETGDVQLLERREQIERKRILGPVLPDSPCRHVVTSVAATCIARLIRSPHTWDEPIGASVWRPSSIEGIEPQCEMSPDVLAGAQAI